MHGRTDQHALAKIAWQLEDRVVDIISGCFVQQTVIAAPRRDVQLPRGDQIVQNVGINTGRVHNAAGLICTVLCMDSPSVGGFYEAGHFRIESELHAILIGILRQRDRQTERTNNTACRRPQRRDRVLGHMRLQLVQPLRVDQLQLLDAVFDAVFIERVQLRQILLRHAHDKTSVLPER